MQELFRNFHGIDLLAERAHSRSDLKKFLDLARRDRSIRAVHIVSHGLSTRQPAIVLTGDEKINLTDRAGRSLFRNLKIEVIFFSCCELGRDQELMRDLLKISRAGAIFSYAGTVNDYQAFITESLFYHLAYGYFHGRESKLSLEDVWERMKFSLHFLGIDNQRDSLGDPLLVADFKTALRL